MSAITPAPTLIFGGSGFLGAHVVAAAAEIARDLATFAEPSGPPVVSVSRAPAAAPDFCSPRGAARPVPADALKDGEWEAVLAREKPERVILCTALSSISECEAYPALARKLNVELPRRVAAWCASSGARLVHVSTDLVFGARAAPQRGFSEDDEVGPLSVYGATKAEGESAVLDVCAAALVVRLPLLYGDSGARARGASDSLLEAIHRGEPPILFTDELRTPLEVRNAAAALIELAAGELRGRLHVAGPERVSRHAFGLEVLRAMGLGDEEARGSIRAGTRAEAGLERSRPADVALDISRARRALATPLLGVREGLARALS